MVVLQQVKAFWEAMLHILGMIAAPSCKTLGHNDHPLCCLRLLNLLQFSYQCRNQVKILRAP